jgi:hypothetical protein
VDSPIKFLHSPTTFSLSVPSAGADAAFMVANATRLKPPSNKVKLFTPMNHYFLDSKQECQTQVRPPVVDEIVRQKLEEAFAMEENI